MTDHFERSLHIHAQAQGKVAIKAKVPLETMQDLAAAYSPGVARPCQEIHKDPEKAKTLTIKQNSVAVVSDGTAVLGLGDIGPLAAIPVMEGKALLFKQFGDIDAWPICLDTQDTEEIIETVRRIAPVFGGINLEDISAPRCFEIERRLQDLGIPVFHDDQHGTAIVLLGALINSCKVLGKKFTELRIVINGAGAAGTAIAQLLTGEGYPGAESVKEVVVCDSKGIISTKRGDLNDEKKELLQYTNPHDISGTVQDALRGCDVFVGVSKANQITQDDVRSMAKDPMIFAMANPIPEIMPDEALKAGAAIVGTGRSDFPNQVNNALAFPGLFRGALDAHAKRITPEMKLAAAYAIAEYVKHPTRDQVVPQVLDKGVATFIAKRVKEAWAKSL